ncbi:MAG: TetR/AcrR family transcriptional regulator [Deltaproteobacteria bacterium]|nr:TetR/AcrR family transcriptional regulator [Deltaproteobacteria bacterium]
MVRVVRGPFCIIAIVLLTRLTYRSKKIAKAAGVAVGSFYNHFPDKKSLLFEINRRHSTAVHEMVAEKVRHIFTTEDVDSRILTRELIRQVPAMHSFSPDLHRELTALAYTDTDFQEKLNAKIDQLLADCGAEKTPPITFHHIPGKKS